MASDHNVRSGDKSGYQVLAQNLVQATNLPVAAPNYRLSPSRPLSDIAVNTSTLKHPSHTEDIAMALGSISAYVKESCPQIDKDFVIFLVGHSCGAHMISTLILDPPEGENTRLAQPIPPELHELIKGSIIIEGIYDLDLLLADFPDYKDFIYGAFPAINQAQLSPFSVNHYAPRQGARTPWLVLHSPGDTLVNVAQAQAMYEHLVNAYSQDNAESRASLIRYDFTTLTQDHDDLLEGQEVAQLISRAVKEWMQ